MNFSITPELEALIAKKVKSGMYHSASEVIREALRLLKERDELKELKLKELKREIKRGYDSSGNGKAIEWNVDKFNRKVQAQALNGKKNKT